MNKVIGIPGFINSDKMFGVTGNYMEFANNFGDVRIIMPHEEHVEVDLLLLPGGMDLNPTSYKQIPGYQTGHIDVFKQFFFDNRLENYVGNTAIFGICLGFQQLNVHFGGTLTQNLLGHPTSNTRWTKAHEVFAADNSGKEYNFEVNSHHHQGIYQDDLAKDLVFLAGHRHNAKDRNPLVESFCHTTLPIGGVQWHPEEFYDDFSRNLIHSLMAVNEEQKKKVAAVVEAPTIQ